MAPTSGPLGRASLRSGAADRIRTQISAGSLTPGELHSVGSIANELQVSATPVREALVQLANEGLIEIVQNRGFRVRVLSDQDLDHILEIRLVLEVPAMGRLAQRRPQVDLSRFRPIAHELTEHARASRIVDFVALDRTFHLGLTALLGNPRYVDMVDRLRGQTRLSGLSNLGGTTSLIESAEEHERLLDLIEAGSHAATEELMSAHLQHTRGLWAGRAEPVR